MKPVRVRDIERAIAGAYPVDRAEEWDRNGLLVGDPDAIVTGVVLALDPTRDAVQATLDAGANVLVTHHPVFLKSPEWLTPGRGAAGAVFHALSSGVALINAHTNLDRDHDAQMLIPDALGLAALKPVERSLMSTSVVTVYAPESAADDIVTAMTGAGAGRIGEYERCSFSSEGEGSFTPPTGATPFVGTAGVPTSTPEHRIEMICPADKTKGVVAAAVAAHPYVEPLVTVTQVAIARNAARMGMLATFPDGAPRTLSDLVELSSRVYGVTPRVWGDPDTRITRVATGTGSAGSLIGEALAGGAQVLVAGEVRYHDALDAVAAGLAVIELGHDVTEWPLVGLLGTVVRGVEGLDPARITALPATPGWWTP